MQTIPAGASLIENHCAKWSMADGERAPSQNRHKKCDGEEGGKWWKDTTTKVRPEVLTCREEDSPPAKGPYWP
jgi:hypothetical protein